MRYYDSKQLKAIARAHWSGDAATFESAWRGGIEERLVRADEQNGAILQAIWADGHPERASEPWWRGLSVQSGQDHRAHIEDVASKACCHFDPRAVARRQEREAEVERVRKEREQAEAARRAEQELRLRSKLERDFVEAGGTETEFAGMYDELRREHLKAATLEGDGRREAQTAQSW